MSWDSPVSQLKEIISCIRHIWNCWQTQTRLNFNGKYYKLNLMTPFFNPGPIDYPDIPIYMMLPDVVDQFSNNPDYPFRIYLEENDLQ